MTLARKIVHLLRMGCHQRRRCHSLHGNGPNVVIAEAQGTHSQMTTVDRGPMVGRSMGGMAGPERHRSEGEHLLAGLMSHRRATLMAWRMIRSVWATSGQRGSRQGPAAGQSGRQGSESGEPQGTHQTGRRVMLTVTTQMGAPGGEVGPGQLAAGLWLLLTPARQGALRTLTVRTIPLANSLRQAGGGPEQSLGPGSLAGVMSRRRRNRSILKTAMERPRAKGRTVDARLHGRRAAGIHLLAGRGGLQQVMRRRRTVISQAIRLHPGQGVQQSLARPAGSQHKGGMDSLDTRTGMIPMTVIPSRPPGGHPGGDTRPSMELIRPRILSRMTPVVRNTNRIQIQRPVASPRNPGIQQGLTETVQDRHLVMA